MSSTKAAVSAAKTKGSVVLNPGKSHHWYDFKVQVQGCEKYLLNVARQVETGKPSMTDPLMGMMV